MLEKKNRFDRERLDNVTKRCDSAVDLLGEIRSKIEQIIEFKKNNPTNSGGGDELMRRQIGAYMVALENLAKINSGVGQAVGEAKELCAQAHLLLSSGFIATKSSGIGAGVGASGFREESEG